MKTLILLFGIVLGAGFSYLSASFCKEVHLAQEVYTITPLDAALDAQAIQLIRTADDEFVPGSLLYTVLQARVHNRLAGIALYSRSFCGDSCASQRRLLYCLTIDKEFQGKGLGSALIKVVAEHSDCYELEVKPNAGTETFYAKNGFIPQGRFWRKKYHKI